MVLVLGYEFLVLKYKSSSLISKRQEIIHVRPAIFRLKSGLHFKRYLFHSHSHLESFPSQCK